jgi:hypothetical protein
MAAWALASLDLSDAASFLSASTWSASVEESSMGALPQPTNRMAGTMIAPAKQFLRLKVLFISELPLAITIPFLNFFLWPEVS